jgi:C4-dicarboxylate-binding protein DctP
MVQQGALDMALAADGAVTGFYPKLQVFAIPYLFKSSPVAWEFTHQPLVKEMQDELLETTGLRSVVWAENGFRNLTNSKHEVKGPEDMQGLKMRVMESPVYMRFMESLGAAATPISFAELVMSLQQGVVDGQENASSNVFENGMADVQKYFSTTEHIYSMTLITINDDFYQSLTPGQQQIIMEAGRLYAAVANAFKVSADREYIERIRDEKGLQVHITTAEEKEAFRELSQGPVVEYLNEQLGKEFVDRVLAAVDEAEQNVYGQ